MMLARHSVLCCLQAGAAPSDSMMNGNSTAECCSAIAGSCSLSLACLGLEMLTATGSSSMTGVVFVNLLADWSWNSQYLGYLDCRITLDAIDYFLVALFTSAGSLSAAIGGITVATMWCFNSGCGS